VAHLVFFPFPEGSHLTAFLGLAAKLGAAGHRITFIVVPDAVEAVRARGHATVTYAEDLYPPGTRERFMAHPGLVHGAQLLWGLRMNQPSTRALVEGLRPDLLLVDSMAYGAALAAYRSEIGVLLVSPIMSSARDPAAPPLSTAIVPGTLRARLATRLAWARRDLARRVTVARQLVRRLVEGTSTSDELGARLVNHTGSYPRLVGFHELILCPAAFELPHARRVPGQHHVEACIDVGREAGQALDLEDDARPLVYCSFGVAPKSPARVRRAARAALQAMAARPHLRMLIVLPPFMGDDVVLPANVTRRRFVPQLAALARSALAVTHGGLGTVKECISAGVPMVVVPIGSDQPGNAARVAFHGLGRVLMPDTIDAVGLGAAIDAVLADAATRARVARMRDAFAAAEGEGRAVAVVASRLPARARGTS